MLEQLPLMPDGASTLSGRVDALFLFLVGVSAFFTLLICSALVVLGLRYRRRSDRESEAVEGSTTLELLWTGIPLLIVLGVFGWSAKLYYDLTVVPVDGMPFTVTGKQWMWKIQHPTGQREINALHVPVGTTCVLTMTSEDVIHSFYVPAFRTKADVVPGRYTQLWFQPTRAGTYHLFCAEYCGTKHSEMNGWVEVMEPALYEAWLSGQPRGASPEESGRLLFENLRCQTCHAAGSGQRGPVLDGLFGAEVELADGSHARFDEAYVRESILQPNERITRGFQPLMPTYTGQVSEEQILELIAYLRSLEKGAEDPR
jgi:cytochrome c oxidase subunit 2